MYTITCKHITRTYPNGGQHKEQALAFTVTGELRKHDSVPFDKGSDIPELHMSVKSDHATLASARLMHGKTFAEQLDEFFQRAASEWFAYVTDEEIAYVMNPTEFREFVATFGKWERESSKNGGGYKIRLGHEGAAMLRWLSVRAA